MGLLLLDLLLLDLLLLGLLLLDLLLLEVVDSSAAIGGGRGEGVGNSAAIGWHQCVSEHPYPLVDILIVENCLLQLALCGPLAKVGCKCGIDCIYCGFHERGRDNEKVYTSVWSSRE